MGNKYVRLWDIVAWYSKRPGTLGTLLAELLAEYDQLTTPLTEEQERAAFEKWASADGFWSESIKRHPDGYYLNRETRSQWNAWQARASLDTTSASRELPKHCEYCDDTGDVHSLDGEWRGTCTECIEAQAPACELSDEELWRIGEEYGLLEIQEDDRISLNDYIASVRAILAKAKS